MFQKCHKKYIFCPFSPYHIILTYPPFKLYNNYWKNCCSPTWIRTGEPWHARPTSFHCSITSLMKSLGQLVNFEGKYSPKLQYLQKNMQLCLIENCVIRICKQKKILPLSTDFLMFYYSQKQQILVIFEGLPLDEGCIYVQTFPFFITAKSRKLKYFLQEFLCIKAVLWLCQDCIQL